MNKQTTVLVSIIFLLTTALIATLGDRYFTISSGPRIIVTEVTTYERGGSCVVQFNLVNAGGSDGFVEVGTYMHEGVLPLDKNRFFVRANTTVTKYLEGPDYDCDKKNIDIRIIKLEQ